MKSLFRSLVAAALLATVAACGTTGSASAPSFETTVQVSTVGATAIVQQADALLVAKKISVADAKNVLAAADAMIAGIGVATTLKASCVVSDATCTATATTRLQAAIAGLAQMQAYLAAKKGT